MEKKKLDWIIRMIKEEMVANAAGEGGGFSSSANPKGPVAGRDVAMGKMMRRKKKYIKLPVGSRKRWMKKKDNE